MLNFGGVIEKSTSLRPTGQAYPRKKKSGGAPPPPPLVAPATAGPTRPAGPAASGADEVLEKAQVFDTVAEAVADCPFVYATTVRKRGLVVPVVSPEEAAREIWQHAEPSAILFGAERSGLETDEVAIASRIVTVPVNPEFRSLNLAQAVILVAYEWSKGARLAVPTEGDEAEPRASQDHLEGLIGQLYDALEAADYFHPPDRTPATKNTIRTILTKAGWSVREIQAMRGIVRALAEPRQERGPRGWQSLGKLTFLPGRRHMPAFAIGPAPLVKRWPRRDGLARRCGSREFRPDGPSKLE